MSVTLLLTALAMGLAATPHCAAMCGVACAGLTGTGRGREVGAGTVFVLRQVATDRRTLAFHAGRLTGYSAVGALAALATQGLALLTTQGGALRPLWTLFHLLVLAWGLSLLMLARQPAWAQRASLQLWARIRPAVQGRGSLFAAGLLWVFMPCGLLWSALLVASLTASPWEGALAMGLFATASSIGLVLMPVLMARLGSAQGPGKDWGTRLAGLVLVFAALAALGMDLGQRVIDFCR